MSVYEFEQVLKKAIEDDCKYKNEFSLLIEWLADYRTRKEDDLK